MSAPRTMAPEVESLLEAWDLPGAILDRGYSILAANKAYRALYGGEGEVEGRRCHEVCHRYRLPCDQMGESCPIRETLESREPSRTLHVHWTAHGKQLHEIRIVPIRNGTGEIDAFLELLRPLEQVAAQPARAGLVGTSPPFRRTLELLGRAAPSEATVLLLGETGTGKELLARAVHEMSPRRAGTFVPLDCSGLTEALFESELFGHEKGAFTGATHRKKGLVEAAEGGTLFLDELGDIPLPLQVKLLRLLESGTYRRVGSPEQRRADFRLVCATHRDLEALVRDGAFRADLFYRISAFPVGIPPLRERRSDVPLLAESMLARLSPAKKIGISPEAMDLLERHAFPGNVRELLNVLERAILLCDGETIRPEHLPERLAGSRSGSTAPHQPAAITSLAEQERDYLQWTLERHGGDKHALAEALGISERTLYRKLSELRDRHRS